MQKLVAKNLKLEREESSSKGRNITKHVNFFYKTIAIKLLAPLLTILVTVLDNL